MKQITSNAYEILPEVYEKMMKEINYRIWAKYLHKITKKHLKRNNVRVLELGSGTCSLANELKRYYSNLIASDLSLNMLAYNNFRLPKICCDMTRIPFKGKFDLIISAFDTVNYLTNLKSLNKLFKEVSNSLTDDGIFTFDAALEENSLRYIKVPERKGKTKNFSYTHQTSYDINKKIHTNKFQITDKDGNLYKETHKQKIYSFDTYFKVIMQNGMFVSECFEGFTLDEPGKNSLRLQFIVKKLT